MGGIEAGASGLAVKHRTTLFDVLGSRFGLLDQVRAEEQRKLDDGTTTMIRVWIRSNGSGDTSAGGSFMERVDSELSMYRSADGRTHVDYSGVEGMLEDGWVLD